jgi:aspartate carbamoyltransferase catalytic subunit
MNDLTKEDILFILKKAKEMDSRPRKAKSKIMENKIVASLFFEPSTRTRLSFETAAQNLGARVVGFADPNVSSFKKGETLTDTIKMVERYSDIIVMRHFINGAARRAAEVSMVPVVNAGDGSNQHPSQTLLDLYTIQKAFGKFDGLTIGFLGDLKYGRTVRGLAKALTHFKPKKFYFIAPESLQLQHGDLSEIKQKVPSEVCENYDKCISELDLLYVTRIQKERFPDEAEYEKVKGIYVIDMQTLRNTKKNFRVMHPLPRVGEITPEIDRTPAALYFEQAANGIPVREAILGIFVNAKKGAKK